MEHYMIPCLFLKYTGIPCPGCGGQRSLYHLFHGEFSEAFFMYPAIYPLFITAILILFQYIYPFKQYSSWVSMMAIFSIATVLINYGIELEQLFHFI